MFRCAELGSPAFTDSGRITRHFHEKAADVKSSFIRATKALDSPTNGRRDGCSSVLLLERFLAADCYPIRSPTNGRRSCLPALPWTLQPPNRPTSIRTLDGAVAPVPAGCSQLGTGAAFS